MLHFKLKIASLIFLFASIQLLAQNGMLTGKIFDVQNNDPLIGATISADEYGEATDFDGNYELSLPPGEYTFYARYLGYGEASTTKTIRAGETTNWDIGLAEAGTMLQTATVSSSKFEKALGEVTVSLEILQPDLIESTGKLSLDEALQKIPGVVIIDGSANIRGGSGYSQGAGSRVLLLLDDVPILQADAGYPQWDDVPIEIIEQVEVIKGAASALYGSSALNGVVNVRTAYARSEPETRGSVFYKTYADPERAELKWWDSSPTALGASVSHRQKFESVDLVLGSYFLNDQSFRKDTYRKFGRFNFNVRHRVSDRLNYGLAGNLNKGESGSYFFWAGLDSAYVGNNTTISSRKRFRYNLDPFINYYDNSGNRHRFLGRFYAVDNDNDNNQSNKSKLYYAEYQFQKKFENIELVLSSGLVASGNNVEAELYGDTTFTSQNYAVYLQLDKTFFDRLNASFGFRYENNVLHNPGFSYVLNGQENIVLPSDDTESLPVFRFGLNYQAGKATYFRASWGQGYRYPTIAEKYIFTNAGFPIVPSPDLGSETGWSAEMGLKQGYRFGNFEGFLDVAAFVMNYDDMIEFNWASLGLSSGFQSINIGGTEISGLEITLAGRGKIGPIPFRLLTGYTTIDPQFKSFNPEGEAGTIAFANSVNSSSPDNILKYRSRNTFKFDGALELGKFNLGLESIYNSHIETVDAVFNIIIPGLKTFRDNNADGAWNHSVRLAYKHNEHIKATAVLGNILNTEYALRPALLEAPRNITVRLDWSF